MEFKLNEYHRDISDRELISDVQATAKKLGCTSLTKSQYAKNGTYHSSTLEHRFGSWKRVLELSALEIRGHNWKYALSDEDVIADIHRVAQLYGKISITAREYSLYGKCHSSTLITRYGTWNNVLKLADMRLNLNRRITDEDMFMEIERIWVQLGRQPTSNDIKEGVSKFSLNSYTRRYGGWRNALKAFVEYINASDSEYDPQLSNCTSIVDMISKEKIGGTEANPQKHQTPRDINTRLRFKVLQRDNFKCCACGASPAKDFSVELQIDHIIPWSKGGETEIGNLQTLCSKCNLGKSNVL